MKSRSYIGLVLITAYCLVVSACGGGGGGGTPAKALAVTATTPVLINYSTTVFANFSGTTVSNGTAVTFSATTPGVLTASTVVGADLLRTATVRVKSASQANVTVSASAGGYSGSKVVQFIPMPNRAIVHVSLNRNINDLAAMNTIVKSNISAFTNWSSVKVSSTYAGSTTDGINSFTNYAPVDDVFTWLLTKLGINVTPSNALLDITYRINSASTGIPFFTVVPDALNPERTSFNRYSSPSYVPSTSPLPAVILSPSDYLLITDYYLGSTLLATH